MACIPALVAGPAGGSKAVQRKLRAKAALVFFRCSLSSKGREKNTNLGSGTCLWIGCEALKTENGFGINMVSGSCPAAHWG